MELLERKLCLAELGEWFGAASERGGCIALVGGEAGIGKTATTRAAAVAMARNKSGIGF
jgi:tRNA A37 threonylcarbamoyladenosine biosynthesis protein TsaE